MKPFSREIAEALNLPSSASQEEILERARTWSRLVHQHFSFVAKTEGRLHDYLQLERELLVLESTDKSAADAIGNRLDPLWYQLSDEEQDWLRKRGAFENILKYHGLAEMAARVAAERKAETDGEDH